MVSIINFYGNIVFKYSVLMRKSQQIATFLILSYLWNGKIGLMRSRAKINPKQLLVK